MYSQANRILIAFVSLTRTGRQISQITLDFNIPSQTTNKPPTKNETILNSSFCKYTLWYVWCMICIQFFKRYAWNCVRQKCTNLPWKRGGVEYPERVGTRLQSLGNFLLSPHLWVSYLSSLWAKPSVPGNPSSRECDTHSLQFPYAEIILLHQCDVLGQIR